MRNTPVIAVVLAAGFSRRMGKPKLNLPWGDKTVIEHVISVLKQSYLEGIIVVESASNSLQVVNDVTRTVTNSATEKEDMLGSLQSGLKFLLSNQSDCAALIVLGDMPGITEETVSKVIVAWRLGLKPIVVPSYRMRRGHPWLVESALFSDILSLAHPKTLRDFLNLHTDEIDYVNVNTDGILQDLDTPEDYERLKPSSI